MYNLKLYFEQRSLLDVSVALIFSFNFTTCNYFDEEASLRAEAAIFASKRLDDLLHMKFGLLIFDTCLSTAITQKLLADALYGTTKYCERNNKTLCLNRERIVGIIGDFSSHITLAVSRFTSCFLLSHIKGISNNYEFFSKFLDVYNFIFCSLIS